MSIKKVAFIGSTDTFDRLILMELYNELELSQIELSQSMEMDLAHFLPDVVIIDATIDSFEVRKIHDLVKNSPILSEAKVIRLGEYKGIEDLSDVIFIDKDPDKDTLLKAVNGEIPSGIPDSKEEKDNNSPPTVDERTKIYDISQLIDSLENGQSVDGVVLEGTAPVEDDENIEDIEEIEVIETIDDKGVPGNTAVDTQESIPFVEESDKSVENSEAEGIDIEIEESNEKTNERNVQVDSLKIEQIEKRLERLDYLEKELERLKTILTEIRDLLSKL